MVVVGGGITGLTAAYLLATAGKRVVVLERARWARSTPGTPRAHLTMVTDTRLRELVDSLRPRRTRRRSGTPGSRRSHQIDTIVRDHGIDCGFAWVDGYLHAPFGSRQADEADDVPRRRRAGAELGFDADVRRRRAAGRRAGDARSTDRRDSIRASIWPGSPARSSPPAAASTSTAPSTSSATSRSAVKANGFAVTCDEVVIATHNPLVGLSSLPVATLFQTKLALYTSYVVAARVAEGPRPRRALVGHRGSLPLPARRAAATTDDLVIFGGEDHKTGQVTDTPACYAALESALARASARGAT